MATDKGKIASDVIAAVKGKDNIVSLGHCATRLRFVLRDYEKVNINDVKKVYGVITAVEKGGQLQVVIGNTVQEVYHEAIAILGDDLAGKTTEVTKFDWGSGEDWLKMIKSLPNRFFRMIGGIFPRVIMLMAACGIILGLMNLLMVTNVIKDGDDTYQLLNIIGGAALGSLPILLGFSAGRYFGSSGYLTAVIGIILTSPSWTPGQDFSIIGIHFTQFNYAGSVIPILFASFFCCILEKFLMKYLPSAIKQFVTPMICLLLIAPITLLIIGPIFNQVAEWLFQAWGTIDKPELAWIGGLITGALWQVLVIFGVHRTFDVIDTTNLSKTGSTSFVTYHQVAALSQTGAAFGVWLKMRDKAQKRMVLSTVITGVFGVTEPIIYGVTLPRKRPFVMGVIGGLVGGVVAGLIGSRVFGGMPAWGLLSLTGAIDPNNGIGAAFFGLLIGMIVSFGVGALLTFVFCKADANTSTATSDGSVGEIESSTVDEVANGESNSSNINSVLVSPMIGNAIPLTQSSDEVFASEAMGKGVIVVPTQGKLYAPCDGTISVVFETKHMIGMTAPNGAELIMHIGIDTVNLKGEHFTTHVKQGDQVTKGQLLIEFDVDAISAKGYKLETPIIISNSGNFDKIEIVSNGNVSVGDNLISYTK